MDLVAAKVRLAEIEIVISGIKRAFSQAPQTLSETDIPAFVNFVGSANHDQEKLGEDINAESRYFTARLYIVPISSGISGEAEARVEPFIDRCTKAFLARPAMSSTLHPLPLAGIQRMKVISDSGISLLPFGSGEGAQQFLGVEWKLLVEAVVPYTTENSE